MRRFFKPVLLGIAALALGARAADPPAPIIALFRAAAEELADQDAPPFLDHFDRAMPGYADLKGDIEGLLAHGYVVSTIEFVSDEGDGDHRELQIDWLWRLSGGPVHREIVKCRVERKGKQWKITQFEPLRFFRQ